MKKTISGLLSLALAAMVTFASFDAMATGTPEKQTAVSQQLSKQASQDITGGTDWDAVADGVLCGVGIVAIAAGGLSSGGTAVGALVAFAGYVGVGAACASALL
jgi:uncharacterized membrane-anchored protein YitT (DUF2179 family)